MNRRTVLAALAPAALLVAACGSASGGHGVKQLAVADPRAKLLASVGTTMSQSFLADMTITETVTVSGPGAARAGALSGQSISLGIKMEEESAQRVRMTVSTTLAGHSITAVAVVYNGVVSVSTDGGTTFKTVPGVTPTSIASDNALSYLQSVATVTDQGAGTADGVAVERYSAELDGAKATTLMKGLLGTQDPALQKLFSSVTMRSSTVAVALDHKGRVVTEGGPLDMSVDLSGYDASFAGTVADIQATFDAHFHDYGTTVTVSPPGGAAA